MQNNAVITGSYAYGAPGSDSDVDLVVKVSDADFERIFDSADMSACDVSKYGEHDSTAIFQIGSLNLIVVCDDDVFNVWRDGTEHLRAESEKRGAPITRAEAVAYFKEKRLESQRG